MITRTQFDKLLSRHLPALHVHSDGTMRDIVEAGKCVLLPGSFNPLHDGHLGLARAARTILEQPVTFELCVHNVDKPSLSFEAVTGRLGQFTDQHPICLTTAPRFVEKARLFPNSVFVVGADTAIRILAPSYYETGTNGMLQALDGIQQQGGRFLVGCRRDETGQLLNVDGLPIPAQFLNLFQSIPVEEFCLDISSTQLRQHQSTVPTHARQDEQTHS